MINIRQLAKLAQVSPGVVSRVLSEDPSLSISPETRQRVLDMIKKYNYQPTRRNGRKWVHSLCVITTLSEEEEVNDTYFRVMMQGISQAAAEAHYKVKTIYRLPEAPEMNDLPKYAGLVLVGAIEDQVIEKLRGENEHLVLADNQISELVANQVSPNLAGMITQTLDQLNSQGLTQIALIGGRLRSVGVNGQLIHQHEDIRETLFKAAVAKNDALTGHTEIGEWTPAFGYQATQKLVSDFPDVQAIIAASDPIAMGVIRCLHDLKVVVPQKVQVTSFDDLDFAKYLVPSLTTFQIPTMEIGAEAVRILVAELESQHSTIRQLTLQGKLINRETALF